MRNMKKIRLAAVVVSVVLLVGGSVSGTLAWILAQSNQVVNTFTTSGINITLTETTGEEYKMVPGVPMDKDPVVTVKAGSEDCWVFVKIEESNDLVKYISYDIDHNNWIQLTDEEGEKIPGVYYSSRPVLDVEADRMIKVLGAGKTLFNGITYSWGSQQVLTNPDVTEEMMEAVDKGEENPTLTFTAYASQYWKNSTEAFDPYPAWLNVSDHVPAETETESESETETEAGTDIT